MKNDNVNHPSHYAGCSVNIECIDITRHLPFDLGNAVKYMWRAGRKGDSKAKEAEDLRKAIWYINDHVENLMFERDCTKRAEPMIRALLKQPQHGKGIPLIIHALHLIVSHDFDNLISLLCNQVKALEIRPEYKAEALFDKMTEEDKK